MPGVNVTDAVERFKREGGKHAEELVKLLKTITEFAPESGEKIPERPFARRIGRELKIQEKEISVEVFYTFDDDHVVWLMFKWNIS